MDTPTVIILVLVALAAIVAGAISAWGAVRSPIFWVNLGREVALLVVSSAVWKRVFKRMDPDTEARWRESIRQGQEWDNAQKRPRDHR